MGRAMMDIMFRIPSMPGVKKVIITAETIESNTMPIIESGDGAVLKIA